MRVSILNYIMFSMMKSFIKWFLTTSFFFLLSCAQTNKSDQSNEKPSDNAVDKEVINEDYQAELQRNMSGLRQMDDKNQELKREKEEKIKEEELKEVKSWLKGTWEWTGIIYGQRVWAQLIISDDYIVAPSIYGIDDQGSYRIDLENQTIYYGNYSYAKIDTRRKMIFADEGEPYRKISNSTSFSTNSTSNSYNSSSSSNNGNSIAKQLEKLDEEESRLIDEGNKAVRSGRADVALLKVFKMKDINSERIRLARQLGDSDLVRYYESKKNRSESIIRQWGFN